jgi:hypothetical protein
MAVSARMSHLPIRLPTDDWECAGANVLPQKSRKKRSLVWTDYAAWRKSILRLLSDLIDTNALNELRKHPPKYFGSGALRQLSEIISKNTGGSCPDLQIVLADRMREHYEFIRAFHACRTDSIEPYEKQGLIPCDPAALNRRAREIFQNKAGVEAVIQDLAVNDSAYSYRDHNGGKVWFCLEEEELTEFCGHYLLYGSEYLLAIANRIGESDALRKQGRATLIECNVPIDDLEESDIRELARDMLVKIIETYCVGRCPNEITGFGFYIECKLKPQNIVRFHFPTKIPNPHRHYVRED